ncbi:hypothetical protein IPJ63_02790 [Candidatus Nomurabacteria bacterium]|nr:MAG: hypothetical protein IPJ63_02790 [Candidatus Nomurabacteria bacterium]
MFKKLNIFKVLTYLTIFIAIALVVSHYSKGSGNRNSFAGNSVEWTEDYIWVSNEYPKNPQVTMTSNADTIVVPGMAGLIEVKNSIGEGVDYQGNYGGWTANREMRFKWKDPSIKKMKVPIRIGKKKA